MTETQKITKRENRRKKRQLKHQLVMQAKTLVNDTSISENIYIDESFKAFALKETRREINSKEIEAYRIPLLKKVMELR